MLFIILPFLILGGCKSNGTHQNQVELSPIMRKALSDRNSVFYADFASFPKDKKMLPIGVFDSGTGGLTVLEVMLKIDRINNITGAHGADGLPDFIGEDFAYLGDLANMPYGNYAAENKSEFFKELVVKDALFLLDDKYYKLPIDKTPEGVKQPCKILVIACNTATAWGLNDVSTLLEESGTRVKVIGVINAGVNALFDYLSNAGIADSLAIGILATKGTISSDAYRRTIMEEQEKNGYAGKFLVVNHACAGFAESVDMEPDFVNVEITAPRPSYRGPRIGTTDDDINTDILDVYNFSFADNAILYRKRGNAYDEIQLNSAANYARFHLVNLIEKHRKSGSKAKLQSIILGCTHYPFLLDTLNAALSDLRNYKRDGNYVYRDLIAENMEFIDPAVFTAMECYNALRSENELALRSTDGRVDAYISVPSYGLTPDKLDGNGNLSYNYKYGREYGTEEITTLFVPFAERYVGKENCDRLQKLVPLSYHEITKIKE